MHADAERQCQAKQHIGILIYIIPHSLMALIFFFFDLGGVASFSCQGS
jgi:hypothetical protein